MKHTRKWQQQHYIATSRNAQPLETIALARSTTDTCTIYARMHSSTWISLLSRSNRDATCKNARDHEIACSTALVAPIAGGVIERVRTHLVGQSVRYELWKAAHLSLSSPSARRHRWYLTYDTQQCLVWLVLGKRGLYGTVANWLISK